MERLAKCWFKFRTEGESAVRHEMLSWATDIIINEAFEKAELDWALNIVTLNNSFTELVNMINNQSPEFYNSTFNYCIEKTNYQIYVELKNGTKHKIDDINALINH